MSAIITLQLGPLEPWAQPFGDAAGRLLYVPHLEAVVTVEYRSGKRLAMRDRRAAPPLPRWSTCAVVAHPHRQRPPYRGRGGK